MINEVIWGGSWSSYQKIAVSIPALPAHVSLNPTLVLVAFISFNQEGPLEIKNLFSRGVLAKRQQFVEQQYIKHIAQLYYIKMSRFINNSCMLMKQSLSPLVAF